MKKISHGDVLSLQQTLDRANSEGIYISRYLTVQGINSGALKAQKVGKTYLIQWELFLEWVMGNSGAIFGPRPEQLYADITPMPLGKKETEPCQQRVEDCKEKKVTIVKPVRRSVKNKKPQKDEKLSPRKRMHRRKEKSSFTKNKC